MQSSPHLKLRFRQVTSYCSDAFKYSITLHFSFMIYTPRDKFKLLLFSVHQQM